MVPHVLPTNAPQGNLEGDVKSAQSFPKGSKRLFSHTLSRHSQDEDSGSNYGSGNDGRHLDEDDPFEKRHRTSDWPLGGNGKAIKDAAASEVDAPASPTSNYSDDAIQPRSSRFIEGSMRNRASQKPPRKYVVTETELDCADANEITKNEKPHRNKLIRHSNHSVPAVAGEVKTETGRQSTIFRFGKSLAASFNPSNWKIWSKSQDTQVPDDKADAEAQAKLERAYREVKNIAPTPGRRFGGPGGSAIWSNAHSSVNSTGMDRSSVDISEQSPQKRYGMVFGTPPSVGGPGGDYGSAQQSTSKLSTPADLYSVPSHQLLHSNDSRSSFTYGSIAPPGSVKHVPSRKDLRAQKKLVKRVSNLESKLEAARLELVKSLGNTAPPPPARGGKSRFVPGALSSLPSESLLSGYARQNEYASQDSSPNYIGAALTTDEKISLAATARHQVDTPAHPRISSFASSVREIPHKDTNAATAVPEDTDQVTPSKKRKSIAKTSTNPSDDDTSSSQHPKDQTDAPPNPAKKPRSSSRIRDQKPNPELLLPDSSSSSDRGFENVDPEKKAVLVPFGAKQQGAPKLIVKKRVPVEGGGSSSRIPRKGSRRGTTPSVGGGDENSVRVASGDSVSQAGGSEVGGGESAARRQGRLKKTARAGVKGTTEIPQEEKKAEIVEKGKMTTSTSQDSFEWGPDVF